MSQKIIPLYPDKIPNAIAGPDEETVNPDGWFRYEKVSKPTLEIYLPAKEIATGAAVVICPGGGYSVVAYKHEGVDVAETLAKAGIAAFVLKYRLPSDKTMTDKTIGPLQDAQQAIKTVRQHAKEWSVNPAKVGILGFSAGGHLAATAGTHYKKALISNKTNVNLRPDFMILVYPVISFTDSLGHLGSRNKLLGKSPTPAQIKWYSNEEQVTSQTPPTFLVHALNDGAVKVENSIRFNETLKKNNVPTDLFIYKSGGHGFGLINPTSDDRWMDHCLEWMKGRGLLTK